MYPTRPRRPGAILALAALAFAPLLLASAVVAGPPPPASDELDRVVRELAAREYEYTQSDGVLQAPNREQDFRSVPERGGLTVFSRTASYGAAAISADWTWSWRTVRFGRGDALHDVVPTQPRHRGARVEYVYADLTEWWENRPEGIEQGFTISHRPAGVGPLRIEGEVPGPLTPKLAAPDRIDFLDGTEATVVVYDGLKAVDASGYELPSSLDVIDGRIVILVQDEGARYPVCVDPLVTGSTLESGHSFSHFGASVCVAGDVNGDGFSDVLIGAPDWDNGQADEGKVFLWYGSSDGLAATPGWTWEPNLATQRVGVSVSTAGDLNGDGFDDFVIGAPSHSSGPISQGAAYVFIGHPAGPGPSPDWELVGGAFLYELGSGVADAGDVNGDGYDDLLIGVRGWTNPELWEGAVLLYLGGLPGPGDPTGLGASPTTGDADWRFESNDDSTRVAAAIGTAGDINGDGYDDIIIGGPRYDNAHGAAWVFLGGPGGLGADGRPANADWSTTAFAGSEFGTAVAGVGDVNGDGYAEIAIGTPYYTNGHAQEGWAGVYSGTATGPAPLPTWSVESNQANAHLGASVASAGDVNGDGYADLLVGAPEEDGALPGQVDFGRVYLFEGSGAGLATTTSVLSYGPEAGSAHGSALSSAGDIDGDGFGDVIIGAPFADGTFTDEGQAVAMRGSAVGVSETAFWTVQSNQLAGNLGFRVASAGDVNADGYSDVLVGAPNFDAGEANEGVVFLHLGGASGVTVGASWTAQSNEPDAQLGFALDGAGDVNGDGYDDVIIAAPGFPRGGNVAGAVFLWYGSPAGLGPNGTPMNPDRVVFGDQIDTRFGSAVAGIGDVNGDGYHEVAIGDPEYVGVGANSGSAWIHFGGPAGTEPDASWEAHGDSMNDGLGSAVAGAGDVNGDGFSDVAIGASRTLDAFLSEGAVHVWHGSAAGLGPDGTPSNAAWTAFGGQEYAWLGDAVATAGDVNADGFSDLIAGVWSWSGGQTDEGQARVWFGGAAGLGASPVWIVEGGQESAHFGWSVSAAGDVNHDGFGDVLVGAPRWDGAAGTQAGQVRVYAGSATGLTPGATQILQGDESHALFGWSVAGELDVNGDGFRDMLVGAPEQGTPSGEGRATAYFGNGGDGLDRIPRQLGPAITPLARLGASPSVSSFRIHARARSAAGRSRVRLQWEVKEFGDSFDGSSLSTAPLWATSGSPVPALGSYVDLGLPETGLAAGTYFHWRVRILGESPRFPSTPWLTLPGNAPSERDLRTGGPGVVAAPIVIAGGSGGVALSPPWPNPFPARATIEFVLPQRGDVEIVVVDVAGRRVATLARGPHEAGRHLIGWNGRSEDGARTAAGVYFVRLSHEGQVRTRKLVHVR